ncbi:MAG: 16S rRNA processing protein RimM [Helicobacteraceae bacterium CG2_30_36_10]|nr:MAG: 16S rRNA processing protein RimM [Helicobacteraceae bacterium CG2_30_36_10]
MSKQSKEQLLHIATIGKTVGIKGDMKFHIKCDFPEQFENNSTFLINKKEKITLSEVNHERGILKIEGVNSVEDAKKYTNVKLFTTYEDTKNNCHLDDGQFFWFDIIGCEVFEDGKLLGKVEEVERIAISDYLCVKTNNTLVESGGAKSFLIPYHKPFIISTDINTKVITVSGAMDILEAS